MTTLNLEQKDILEKLNEIALEVNWGTAERVNGVPKAVAVIKEAMEEIKRLRELPKEIFGKIKNNTKRFEGKRKTIDYIVGYKQAIIDYDNKILLLKQIKKFRRKLQIEKEYGVTLDEKN